LNPHPPPYTVSAGTIGTIGREGKSMDFMFAPPQPDRGGRRVAAA
jgi:hypothetical protein